MANPHICCSSCSNFQGFSNDSNNLALTSHTPLSAPAATLTAGKYTNENPQKAIKLALELFF